MKRQFSDGKNGLNSIKKVITHSNRLSNQYRPCAPNTTVIPPSFKNLTVIKGD